MASKVLAASLAATVLTLHGCGGGGGSDGTTPPATTSASPTAPESSTTTTTSTARCTGRPVVPEPPDTKLGHLARELNDLFLGFKPDDPASPSGVTVQMLAFKQDAYIRCGHGCQGDPYASNGGPDCRVSASIYNSEMPLHPATDFSSISREGRIFGVVFNQTGVETKFGKCAYMYDAASWGRMNRGCGCGSKMQGNCAVPDGPFQNQDCEYAPDDPAHWHPLPGTCKNNTEASPTVEQCWCKSQDRQADTPEPKDMTTTSQQCYFRMPAMYPPHGAFDNELHEMVSARVSNQLANETLADGSVRIREEYWNEVILDGEALEETLAGGDISHGIAAIVYVQGMGGVSSARKVQSDFQAKYGGQAVPILEVDSQVDVKCSGLFRVPDSESQLEATLV